MSSSGSRRKRCPDAITATWPEATVQTCVVHLVRNSLRYASKAHWSAIAADMRTIYTAPTVEAAQARFGDWLRRSDRIHAGTTKIHQSLDTRLVGSAHHIGADHQVDREKLRRKGRVGMNAANPRSRSAKLRAVRKL